MAETLGSLIDKLTIVKLKQSHSENPEKAKDLFKQEEQLKIEINDYFIQAINGIIPSEKLTFKSNKVHTGLDFKKDTYTDISLGFLTSKLAEVNCEIWHVQEKVYDFKNVPNDSKDSVINELATLNLKRNVFIDDINSFLKDFISGKI